MAMNSTWIFVTFQKEGIHRWPDADKFPGIEFLAHPHRHMFHFEVQMEVYHDDRDVEFIQLKRWLERLFDDGTLELNHKSCEMLSDDLAEKIQERYKGRKLRIIVSEDNENGSIAEY